MKENNNKNVVIVGDGYVGKTCILNAIKENKFEEQIPNVYDEFECTETINGKHYRLMLIDTAGQEEYDMVRQLSYKEANLFLLCFAVDDRISYENLESKWVPDLQSYKNVPVVLVGTKLDLRTKSPNCIPKEEGIKFQKKIGALFYVECSAKTLVGIEDLKKKAFKILSTNSKEKSCVIQ